MNYAQRQLPSDTMMEQANNSAISKAAVRQFNVGDKGVHMSDTISGLNCHI